MYHVSYLCITNVQLQQGGPTTVFLQRVNILIADQEYCKVMYNKQHQNVYDSHLCAYDPSAQKGSCHVSYTWIKIILHNDYFIYDYKLAYLISHSCIYSALIIFSRKRHIRSFYVISFVLYFHRIPFYTDWHFRCN